VLEFPVNAALVVPELAAVEACVGVAVVRLELPVAAALEVPAGAAVVVEPFAVEAGCVPAGPAKVVVEPFAVEAGLPQHADAFPPYHMHFGSELHPSIPQVVIA